MRTLAMVNQKGGVGKTTVALGLAAMASTRGKRVLVVDLDPQANATTGLGVWNAEKSLDQALTQDRAGSLSEIVVKGCWSEFLETAPDLAPSSPRLANIETQLATDPIGAQDRLSMAMSGLDYDLAIIDCPPSMGLLTVNGLFASDRAIVVTEPSAWAVDGVAQIRSNIERIAQRRNGQLKFGGIIVNRLARTRDSRFWNEELVRTYGSDVILPPIANRAVVTEASAQSLPISAMDRSGSDKALDEFASVLQAVVPEWNGLPSV